MTSPRIGSSDYLSHLVAHVRTHLPSDFPLDTRILVGVLLCLIAGQRNLVVDVDIDHGQLNHEDQGDGRGAAKTGEEVSEMLNRVGHMCQVVSPILPPFSMIQHLTLTLRYFDRLDLSYST